MRPIILECMEVGLFMTALLPEHLLFYDFWLTLIVGAFDPMVFDAAETAVAPAGYYSGSSGRSHRL